MFSKLNKKSISLISNRVARHRNIQNRQYTHWPFLKEEHVMVAETCRQFANEELAPLAGKY